MFWFYSDTSPLHVLLEWRKKKKKKKVEGARRSMEWKERGVSSIVLGIGVKDGYAFNVPFCFCKEME